MSQSLQRIKVRLNGEARVFDEPISLDELLRTLSILKEKVVIVRHAMRNALIPIATIMTLSLGGLVEGSFLIRNF